MSKEKTKNDETVQKTEMSDKEYKKKMSRQTAMTVAMVFVSIFVIAVATYAWYLISNAPKITAMEFKADTMGDLWISDCLYSNGTGYTLKSGGTLNIGCANAWNDTLDLSNSEGLDFTSDAVGVSVQGHGDYGIYNELSPVTTTDGKTFYSPVYAGNKVTSVSVLDTNTLKTVLYTKYVYEKTFYLRAGAQTGDAGNKYYNIYLVGKLDGSTSDGCYMRTKSGTTFSSSANNQTGAENALRVSFEFESEKTVTVDYTKTGNEAYATNHTSVVRIYEPNVDTHNTVAVGSGANLNSAGITSGGNLSAYNKVPYATIKQKFDKSFAVTSNGTYVGDTSISDYTPWTTPIAYDKAGTDAKSAILCTIQENVPVKVTMRVWIEGSDADCVNGIAAKDILGQIQFVSEENMAQYGARNTNETSTEYNTSSYFSSVNNYYGA